MNNKEQYIITVRFPEWEQTFEGQIHKYPGFGVRYLLITPLHPEPDWPDDDERWFTYNPLNQVKEDFINWYKANIKKEFDGEVLFIEQSNYVIADAFNRLEK